MKCQSLDELDRKPEARSSCLVLRDFLSALLQSLVRSVYFLPCFRDMSLHLPVTPPFMSKLMGIDSVVCNQNSVNEDTHITSHSPL